MDGNDRPGARCAGLLDAGERHAPAVPVDIHDHRCGAAIEHCVDGCREGEVGHDHFGAWADAERRERKVQGYGAVGDGDCVAGADEAAEIVQGLEENGVVILAPETNLEEGARVAPVLRGE